MNAYNNITKVTLSTAKKWFKIITSNKAWATALKAKQVKFSSDLGKRAIKQTSNHIIKVQQCKDLF